MTELKKYVITYDIGQVNQYVEDGYKLHTYTCIPDSEYPNRFIMSLTDPSKYDDVTKFKKLQITYEEQTVPEGWKIIHHTSKEMILVAVSPLGE